MLNNIKVEIPTMSHYISYNFNSTISSNLYNVLSNSDYCLKMYYQNVRGLRTKLFNLRTNFILSSYDAYILIETWLSDDISNAELRFDGYLICKCDRNVHTSNCVFEGSLIAFKKEL